MLFQGKIRSVKSTLTTTAHSLGEVTVERLSERERETEADVGEVGEEGLVEVVVPFMNENLVAIGKREDGSEEVRGTAITCESQSVLTSNLGSRDYPRPNIPPRHIYRRGRRRAGIPLRVEGYGYDHGAPSNLGHETGARGGGPECVPFAI